MKRQKIWCDGSSSVVCYVIEGRDPVIVDNKLGMTHNESELFAIELALMWLRTDWFGWAVEILSDSQLAIRGITGIYKIQERRLWRRVEIIRALVKDWDVRFTWVPREENEAGKVLG